VGTQKSTNAKPMLQKYSTSAILIAEIINNLNEMATNCKHAKIDKCKLIQKQSTDFNEGHRFVSTPKSSQCN